MKQSLPLAVAVCLPLCSPLYAVERKVYGWFGNASLGGVLTTGNTDTSSVNASLQQKYRSKQWQHSLDLNVLDSRDQGNKTAQRYVGAYRVTFRYLPDNSFFVDARAAVDEFSGYDRQYFETIGYVHRIHEDLNDIFEVEVGVGFTQQTLDSGQEDNSEVVRLGFDWEHDFPGGNRVKVDWLTLSGSDNTYSQFRSSIKTRIVGNVGLEVGQTIQRNSQVANDKKNTDTTTNIGLVYQY